MPLAADGQGRCDDKSRVADPADGFEAEAGFAGTGSGDDMEVSVGEVVVERFDGALLVGAPRVAKSE